MVELSRLAVIRNPHSGSAADTAAIEKALSAADLTATILDLPAGNAEEMLERAAADHDVVVAAGGDGTVSAVAAAVAKAGKTLAIIPAGTLNHFARDAGIPASIDEAIAIVRNGIERAMDVGVVNDHFFLNNVSLGSYPRMVQQRDHLESKGRSHTLATAIAIARTWWHLRKLTADLVMDGHRITRRSPFIVIGNGSYVLSGLSLGKRDEISDGRLSLYVAPSTGRLGALSLPFRALIGKLEAYERFETFCADRISATFRHRRVETGIDGEVRVLESPLRFEIRRAALRVLVPFDSHSGSTAPEMLAQGKPAS
ncbi:MAG: sphingosine kinase [Cyanobacteria bacterium]|nr:sphingosine kinase [Cyanobacteriota bacterium]